MFSTAIVLGLRIVCMIGFSTLFHFENVFVIFILLV